MNDSLLDFYYQKYKKNLLSFVIVIAGCVIIWQVTVPQIYSIFQKRDDIDAKQQEVAKLETSLTTLNSFNDSTLDNDIKTATTALPSSKEFLAMYIAVVSASTKAEVSITNFATQIGTLYVREGGLEVAEKSQVNGVAPSLLMKVTVDAESADQVKHFSDELHAVLPLAEVDKISYSNGQADFEILFYYNKVNSTSLAKQVNIEAISPSERKLLEELSTWNKEPVIPTGALLPAFNAPATISTSPAASGSSQVRP